MVSFTGCARAVLGFITSLNTSLFPLSQLPKASHNGPIMVSDVRNMAQLRAAFSHNQDYAEAPRHTPSLAH